MDSLYTLKFYSCLYAIVSFCCMEVYCGAEEATKMLWVAVEKNDLTGILDAIHSRADIKWRNGTGFTSLHLAAARGRLEALSVLLLAGADKEAMTNSSDRPLHLAAANGRDAAVALLAVAGANIEATGSQGWTSLMEAVFNGKSSTAALLRAFHTNVHSTLILFQEVYGETQKATQMLWTATEKNDLTGVLDAIHSRADLYWKNGTGFTALHLAAASKHVEVLSILLMAGADKEAVTDTGDRSLHLAAAKGSDAAVALLVVAGAIIKAPGSEGWTPIMKAVFNGKNSTAALLRALSYAHDAKTSVMSSTQAGKASQTVVSWRWGIYTIIPLMFARFH